MSSSDEFEFSWSDEDEDEEDCFEGMSDLGEDQDVINSMENMSDGDDGKKQELFSEQIEQRDALAGLLQRLQSKGKDVSTDLTTDDLTQEQLDFANQIKNTKIEQIQEAIQANLAYQKNLEQKVEQISQCIDQARDMQKKISKCYQEYVKFQPSKQSQRKKYLDKGAGKRKWGSFWHISGYTPPQPPEGSQQMQEIINLKLKERSNWSKTEDEQLTYGLLQYSIDFFIQSRLQIKSTSKQDDNFPVQHQLASNEATSQKLRQLTIKSGKVLEYIDTMEQSQWEDMISQYCGWYHSYEDCYIRWINHLHPNINKQPFSEQEDEQIISLVMRNFSYVEIVEKLDSNRRPWQVHDRFVELTKSVPKANKHNAWTIMQRNKLKKAVEESSSQDWQTISECMDNRYTPLQCFLKHQQFIRNDQYYKDEISTSGRYVGINKKMKEEQNLERFDKFVDGWTADNTRLVIQAGKKYFSAPKRRFVDFMEFAVYLFPGIPENQLKTQFQRIFQDLAVLKKFLPKYLQEAARTE